MRWQKEFFMLEERKAPSRHEIERTCCFCGFGAGVREGQKPQVAMKTKGLVAFEEFEDAIAERILHVGRAKSPK
ncbi:hypothetical protein [Butyrivibrio sp. NC2002]|uniref:hypothetical protein n=1 Tax=Butyrivibrio sp. NC2002 TaxID=1410610 RepID=UPI000568229B|nr:hypothetical protein [Butyrivibrio sp. NC2002]